MPAETGRLSSPVTMQDGAPTTGHPLPALRSFDDLILARMKENHIPGAAVAIVSNGRLIYARGYGYADREKKTPVEPTSLFRIASVSKPITGVAVTTLAQSQRYRLNLDTPVLSLLGLKPFLKPGAKEDPRVRQITIRNLLQHSGGWNRDKSGDIMFKHFQIAREMGIASPPDHTSLLRWGFGQPLDVAPGQEYAYSNFGFCVLGRVIEKVTGMSYEQYVRDHVLAPMGITRMRIGKGHLSERFEDEVVYYDGEDRKGRSVFSADGRPPIPLAYAFNSPEVMDAHGGWIASAVDLVRFAARMDQSAYGPVITPAGADLMFARPSAPLGQEADGKPSPVYYGFGWQVRDLGKGKINVWHTGGMPGTSTILVRLDGGRTWALLFNSDNGGDMDGLMHRAASRVRSWPKQDLFPEYR